MIILKYWNEKLQIALLDWRNVYQFPLQEKMSIEVHQGKLYYRCRGAAKRVSYAHLKKGLVKKQIVLHNDLPF